MNNAPTQIKDWCLTPAAFENLLAQIDPDREQAGLKYELLRQRLIKFFEWRGCLGAAELADETFNRLARRLAKQHIENLPGFCLGIARLVALEALRKQEREQPGLEGLEVVSGSGDWQDSISASQRNCFDRCLAALAAGDRELLLQYYAFNKQAKIEQRQLLAEHLGLTPNALRVRACRLRTKLLACVTACCRE